jgi:2-keto-3-deoxy-L-rhamnonate aldolase RhmA
MPELLLVQIESDRGIGNMDEILSVDGIDGAVIGRADLSTDLGLPGQTDHPEIVRRVEMMIAACRRHGKIPGLLVQDIESAKEWIAKGILLVPLPMAKPLISGGARATASSGLPKRGGRVSGGVVLCWTCCQPRCAN